MIKSLIYIRISEQPPAAYAIPLLDLLKKEVPELTTFEFDNFSEESIRRYASELLVQSNHAAVVVEAGAEEAAIAGLTSFFNRMLKSRPQRFLLVLQGTQPVLQKMMQGIAGEYFYQQLPAGELEILMKDFFS